MMSDVMNTKLVKGLVSNYQTILDDFYKVEKYARRMPGKNQNPDGQGWQGIFLRYQDRASKVSKLIPDTMKLVEDAVGVTFVVLHGNSFVPSNDTLEYPDAATVVHFPLIVPQGDLGIRFEDNGEVMRWETGVPLSYKSGRLYEGWNYSDTRRVLLHVVIPD